MGPSKSTWRFDASLTEYAPTIVPEGAGFLPRVWHSKTVQLSNAETAHMMDDTAPRNWIQSTKLNSSQGL
jgi:hypothetical protein